MTKTYDPPSIAPVTLASQSRRVHEARRRLAVARGILESLTNRPDMAMRLQELTDDAELILIAEEDTLRALAAAAFHATGQTRPAPGIFVHERTMFGPESDPYLVAHVTLADDLGAARDAAETAQTSETWR